MGEILVYLCVLVWIFGTLIYKFKKETKEIKEKNAQKLEAEEYGKLSDDYVLHLKKRGAKWTDFLKIHDEKNYIIDYELKRYIFTSATVGGITTGGVDTVGGYNYVSGSVDSDKCTLQFWENKIEVIQLTDALYQKAQKSEIKSYLNEKKQIVVEDKDASLRALGGVSMLGSVLNTPAGALLLQNAEKNGYPTRKKCIEILNWLCEV